MKNIVLLIPLLLSANISFSQPCKICSEALKVATNDVFLTERKQSLDESISVLYSFDFDFWEKYESSNNKTMSLDAAYSVYKATFGSTSNASQRKEAFSRQKTNFQFSKSLSQDVYERISQQLVNKIPFDTFRQCMIATCGNGIFVNYETSGDDIIVTVTWTITGGTTNAASVLKSDPTIANAVALSSNLHKGAVLKPFNSISGLYKRIDSKQPSLFTFDFENFGSQIITVKKISAQNSMIPVGSIVASMLDYSTFCSINEIPMSGANDELIWVPADGRDIKGSKYGNRVNNAPDLRGTFLRAANVFDPINNPTYYHPEQKDPEDRRANSIQKYSVGPHNHDLQDDGHSHNLGLAITGGGSSSVAYRPSGQGTETQLGTSKVNSNISVKNFQSEEARPTNIAVHYYVKIN